MSMMEVKITIGYVNFVATTGTIILLSHFEIKSP